MGPARKTQRVSFEEVEALVESGRQDVSWVHTELCGAALPDERLNKRFIKLTEELGSSPMSPITEACGDWTQAKGAYRFFDNDRIEVGALLAPHINETIQRMKEYPVVLAAQDTVFFGYKHPMSDGLGPIGKSDGDKGRGLVMHHTMVFTPEGLPLGTLTQRIWARDEIPIETKSEKVKRVAALATEEKESWKWMEAAELTAQRKPEGVMVVTVCDRESDFYEFVAEEIEREAPFVVRANWDRKLVPEESEGFESIMEALSQAPVAGTMSVEIKSNGSRKARITTVEVSFVEVTIKPPVKKGAAKKSEIIEPITVRVVAATEINPPAGEDAITWVLLTNLPVKNFDDAVEKIEWYRIRWAIEIHHKVMKSGCRVEACRLENGTRLARFLEVNSIIAYRLMHMTYILRATPDAPCTEILSNDEIEALCVRTNKTKKLPGNPVPLTVHECVRAVAKLGGFMGRKGDGEPGIVTIFRGLQRLGEDVEMLRRFKAYLRSGSG